MADYINVKNTQKIYAEDGGELLRYSLLYPELITDTGGIKKINEFYRTIADKCEEFCVNELRTFCKKKKLEESTYTPLFYKLNCYVSFEDKECVSVVIHAILKKLGTSHILGEYSTVHTFSKDNGLLMPQIHIIKKYMPEIKNPKKYIKKNKGSLLCPSANGIIHFAKTETFLSDNI